MSSSYKVISSGYSCGRDPPDEPLFPTGWSALLLLFKRTLRNIGEATHLKIRSELFCELIEIVGPLDNYLSALLLETV